jgi:GTP-binding protein HflX
MSKEIMSKKITEPTKMAKEKAFLVGVDIYNQKNWLSLEDSMDELSLLASTAGLVVVGEATQSLSHPNPETFIGSGKVQEVITLVNETQADIVIFDEELSPRHQRELEKSFGDQIRVLDRTALILDIFAQHADTREGILQVELAQYEYRLPRLTRAWTHLARQAGGGGGRTGSVGGVGLRGPGETQLEVDRREIRNKISTLKKELEKVRSHRNRYRQQRKRSQIPTVSLVGYTNAGKSTLLNTISKADVYVANQLFATLDPTTKRVTLPDNHTCLFTDTVGFIQKLPTQLIAAFRATLEEISEADLLLHIVDITHPSAQVQWQSVQETLSILNADHIPAITVLNKIDNLHDPDAAKQISLDYKDAVAISAKTGLGINELLSMVENELFLSLIPVKVNLPYQQGRLISIFHEQGKIEEIAHKKGGVLIEGKLPARYISLFEHYFSNSTNEQDE